MHQITASEVYETGSSVARACLSAAVIQMFLLNIQTIASMQLHASSGQDGPERSCGPPLFANDLPDICCGDAEIERGNAVLLKAIDLNGIAIINQHLHDRE
jgi:hypothetical protein